MKLNIGSFKNDILEGIFENNQRKCSVELGIFPAQLNRTINKDCNIGIKFLNGLINCCEKHNLNYRNYIFFDNIVNKS